MAHATRPEEHAVRRLVDRVWNDLDAAAAHVLGFLSGPLRILDGRVVRALRREGPDL